MRSFEIAEAETNLMQLIHSVIKGNRIEITLAGKPVAMIIPMEKKSRIRFGLMKGKIKVSDDFDNPLSDEIIEDFYN